MYRSIGEIKSARRSGKSLRTLLEEIFHSDTLLQEYLGLKNLLTEAGVTLVAEEEEWIDFSTPQWLSLPITQQHQYASEYQQWYAEQKKEPTEKFFLKHGVPLEMALVPPGKFWMGSLETEKGRVSDEIRHSVLIRQGFWCGKYEVTQEQWECAMGHNPAHFKGNQKPLENVNWKECQEFCRKLEMKLLSEAQWEYTCRSGTTQRFYCGEEETDLLSFAWFGSNALHQTHPVGEKKPNAWKIYDMHGNIWEWCEDSYSVHSGEFIVDPSSQETATLYRVSRGGSWIYAADRCRSAIRRGVRVTARYNDLGFRVCKSL